MLAGTVRRHGEENALRAGRHVVPGYRDAAGASKDAFANALYLRNSAWLYSITGETRFMTGSGGNGGAFKDASFIRGRLIYSYSGTPGNSGAQFMIADHLKGCSAKGSQSWLQSQGEMANAASIAGLPHFGFLWDSPNANQPVILATQVSVLDGLNAAMTGSYAMC
jgi:hypothetical protein